MNAPHKKPDPEKDPDDEIEASRAPLLDHLSELRTRLMIAVAALVVAFIACFPLQDWLFAQLTNPFVTAINEAHRTVGNGSAGDPIRMVNLEAFGFFITKMKVVLFAAIILAFPVIAWQAYAFVAPGLYKKERAAVTPFLVAAPVMFLAGAAFVYLVAMPFALQFALEQQQTIQGAQGQVIQIEYLPKVDEYVGLLTTLVLAFGIFFQLPVVLSLLARIGIVTAKMLLGFWRYALVGVAAFSALVTPPDILSMTIMMIPLYAVYLASIAVVWLIERAMAKEDAKGA